MNRAAFYSVMRAEFGSLSQSQVDGTEKLLDEAEKRDVPMNQLAYVLSTVWHECATTQTPIAEYGKGKGYEYGKPLPEYNNQVAYGRGYVQLTWDYNYERADAELFLHGKLLENFDLALDPVIAGEIIFEGMGEGWFTGKKLTDYVNDQKTDYYNARRVVNGTDRADMLAGYAEQFEQALRAGEYHVVHPPEVEPEPEPVEPEPVEPEPVEPEPETPPEIAVEQYEYLVESATKTALNHGIEARLNERGAEGWRLAHVVVGHIIWERRK